MTELTQAALLARPVPAKYVSQVPGGKKRPAVDYVGHSVITEILLMVCGPFDFHVSEIVRDVEGKITGCLATLVVDVDGRRTSVTEVGDASASDEETTEGGTLKNASSDALKRCAMRLGLGLALWSGKSNYFLFDQLSKELEGGGTAAPASADESSSSTRAAIPDRCPACDGLWHVDRYAHTTDCPERPL